MIRPGLVVRSLRAVLVGLLALLVTACGVELQDQAEPLPGGLLPTSSPTPKPTPTEQDTVVYFVAGPSLEGVPEPVSERSAEGIMEALAAGPPLDREAELRSLLLDPLSGEPLLLVVSTGPGGEVVLQRTEGFLIMPATDQVLLIGQVVHSMDGIGLSPMILVDPTGAPVPIALPDGRLQEGGVTAEDFASLLEVAPPEASTEPGG